MSIERLFRCDWRECDRHVRTTLAYAPDFITVISRDPAGERELHFHSWDCILRYAGEIEPAEVIPLRDDA